jgi:hypothetical protein
MKLLLATQSSKQLVGIPLRQARILVISDSSQDCLLGKEFPLHPPLISD